MNKDLLIALALGMVAVMSGIAVMAASVVL